MKIRKPIARTVLASLLSLGVAAVLAGVSAPAANADTFVPGNIDFAASATKNSITLDLSNVHYASAPSGLNISVLRNSAQNNLDCAVEPAPRGTYCYALSEQDTSPSGNFNGVYTFNKLMPNTWYEVEVYPYEPGNNFKPDTQYALVKTLPDVAAQPSQGPLALPSTNGLSVKVTPQAEYSKWNVHDDTPLANLKYNVYAHYSSSWHKVISNAPAGKSYNLSTLPRNTSIYFAETTVNTQGESVKSQSTGSIKLVPASPYVAAPKGVIYPDRASVNWKAAHAGAGHITKYVLTVKSGSKTVYKHTFKSSKRSATVSHLKRKVIYGFTITAYNSYGKHYTSEVVYGRSK